MGMPSEELKRACEMWRGLLPEHRTPVAEARARVEEFYKQFPVPKDVQSEEVSAGGVPALWVTTPNASREQVILYLHGGGYALGSAAGYREMTSRIGRAAGARALVLDYRLAPENPFPAALEDAKSAYRWLVEKVTRPAAIAIAGDSAGGGLTLATLVALRDAGETLPAAAACISPWVDLEMTGESMQTKAVVDPLVSREGLLDLARAYLAGQDPRTPLASPLLADLTGLPPLLIQVGTTETLFDDATRIAKRARAAGVEVTLEISEEMPHVWHVFASFLPEAQQAIDHLGLFVRRHTHPTERTATSA